MTYGWGISDEERAAAIEMATLLTPKFEIKWPTLDYSSIEKRVVDRLFNRDIYETVAQHARQAGKKRALAYAYGGGNHDRLMYMKLKPSEFPRWSDCASSVMVFKDEDEASPEVRIQFDQ